MSDLQPHQKPVAIVLAPQTHTADTAYVRHAAHSKPLAFRLATAAVHATSRTHSAPAFVTRRRVALLLQSQSSQPRPQEQEDSSKIEKYDTAPITKPPQAQDRRDTSDNQPSFSLRQRRRPWQQERPQRPQVRARPSR